MCDHGASNAGVVTKFMKNYAANAPAGVVIVLESKRRSLGLDFEPLWITNQIIVSGSDIATVEEMLQGHKDVKTTMGIIAREQPVGLAPGATWIACRSCLQTGCLEIAIIKCMQWMLCPTRPNGTDPNCSKKLRVVNNSWGTAEYHDGAPRELYNGIISCWRQAGIIPVFSVDNDGPHCSSLGYPGVLKEVLGVGMLSDLHRSPHVNDNSSRGPPAPHWNVTFKPDFIAPGDDIFSTLPDVNSGWLTGTSQAARHVTATIALMLEVNPALGFDDVKEALIGSARPTQVVNPQSCGGISENVYPNFQVGHGSINSYKAVFGRWP